MSDLEARARMAEALANFTKEPAWQFLCDHLEAAGRKAVADMGRPGLMQDQQIHFARGAIWAFAELTEMPQRLRTLIENEIAMARAQARITETEL